MATDKFLVAVAYVDRAEDKAVPMLFVVNAKSLEDAYRNVERSIDDRAWLREQLGFDDDDHPIFDSGVDDFVIVSLKDLASTPPFPTRRLLSIVP